MTTAREQRAASRVARTGLLFLVTASVGWGLNWPVMKFVFSEWPPLSARGWAGVIGAAALALSAVATGVSLKVPADQWPRLIISAILNVALWVAVMSYALLWLPASEAVVIAYTMPVWTALLAWPLLGERLTLLRVTALVMAFAGLASLFGAGGMSANMAKLPGVLLALTGSVGFAVGTIFLKRYPIQMPSATSAAWQIAIGSMPIALAGTLLEHPHIAALSSAGWFALGYMILVGHCIAYVTWFGAVEHLPASVAAVIGTMLAPVIGVVVSAIALHEPFGLRRSQHLSSLSPVSRWQRDHEGSRRQRDRQISLGAWAVCCIGATPPGRSCARTECPASTRWAPNAKRWPTPHLRRGRRGPEFRSMNWGDRRRTTAWPAPSRAIERQPLATVSALPGGNGLSAAVGIGSNGTRMPIRLPPKLWRPGCDGGSSSLVLERRRFGRPPRVRNSPTAYGASAC